MKRDQGFAILEVVLLITVLAILGFTGWTYYQHAKPTAATQSFTGDLKPDAITAAVKTALGHKYSLLKDNASGQPAAGQLGVSISTLSPAYKAPGYGFYTTYAGGSSIGALAPTPTSGSSRMPTSIDVAVRHIIQSTLTNLGFKKDSTRGSVEAGTAEDIWLGRGLVCSASPDAITVEPSMLTCGEVSAYPAAAAKVQDFDKVYPHHLANTFYATPEIKDSATTGYQTASVETGEVGSAGGSTALFYRQTPRTWEFFANTQNALPCTAFNTTDLKNAFKGMTCLDGTNVMTTVK